MNLFTVKVYRHSGASDPFTLYLCDWTSKASNIVFSSSAHGGFLSCTMDVALQYPEAMDVYSTYYRNYISIEGYGGCVAWQGRIESISLVDSGVSISASGLWANASDVYYDDGSLRVAPLVENSIVNLSGYMSLGGTTRKVAQSFIAPSGVALQDICVRVRNNGITDGSISLSLYSTTTGSGPETGTLMSSREMPLSSISGSGEDVFFGLYTSGLLDTSALYWIVVEASGDYWASVNTISGNDTGSGGGRDYLVDSSKDFFVIGVPAGVSVENITKSYSATIASIGAGTEATPSHTVWWRDMDSSSGDEWNDISSAVKDGNPLTYWNSHGFEGRSDYIYVGHNLAFGGVRITLGPDGQVDKANVRVEYGNGSGWTEMPGVSDGTSEYGAPFGKDGTIIWKKPADWPEDDVQSVDGYWVRIGFDEHISIFDLAEIAVVWNDKLEFSDIGSNTWDHGDAYSISMEGGVGYDSSASYPNGEMMYHDGAAWNSYSPARDMVFAIWGKPKFYYTSGASTLAADVVSDAIGLCPLIKSSDAYFDDTGRVVNPIRFTNQERPSNVIDKVLSFGSSGSPPDRLVYGVWDNGYLHIHKESDCTVWYVDAIDIIYGSGSLRLSGDSSNTATRVAVLYSDDVGTRAITEWIVDTDQYNDTGYHKDVLFSIAGATTAMAESMTDVVYGIYTKIQQRVTFTIGGSVMDAGGCRWPVWMLRGGDKIVIRNIIPSSSIQVEDIINGLSPMYIDEVTYHSSSNTVDITPSDVSQGVLDILLAISGLSGGKIG